MISLIRKIIPRKMRLLFLKELSQGNSVLLKSPLNLPKEHLAKFINALKRQPNVEKAYLAEGYLSENEEVHYIIGLFLHGISSAELMQSLAKDPDAQFPNDFCVDYTILKDRGDPIYQYMCKYLKPFYIKDQKWRGSY